MGVTTSLYVVDNLFSSRSNDKSAQNAPNSVEASRTIARTKHPGNAAIAIHDSDKVCALGGWDGKYVFGLSLSSPSPPPRRSRQLPIVIHFNHGTDRSFPLYYFRNRTRLYSVKTFKPLGVLDYHKTGVQALTFARSSPQSPKIISGVSTGSDDDDEFTNSEIEARKRWLVAGGKDGRVSIWELMDFLKSRS